MENFISKNFDEENRNIVRFVKWLKQKVQRICNPIENVVECLLRLQHQNKHPKFSQKILSNFGVLNLIELTKNLLIFKHL